MSYVEQNLMRGEKIILSAKVSKVEIVRAFAVCIIMLSIFWVIAIWLAQYIEDDYLAIPVILFEIIFVFKSMSTCSIELALTNKKIIGKYGVVRTEKMNVPLEYVTAVSVKQNCFEKIFGCGSIIIITSLGDYRFDCIKSADTFKNALMKQIDKVSECPK